MTASLVTTIIPVFDRAAMLREAVASVLAQTHPAVEIIIVDDGSTDDTGAVAESLAREHPTVRVIHQANAGPGAARNAGLAVARGELVQLLDSDDLLLPRKLELQSAALEAHPECGISYCGVQWRYGERLDARSAKRSGESIATLFPAMLQARWWDTPSPLYRTSLLREAGGWLPLRIEEDWELDARLGARGVRLHHVPEILCEVRRHEGAHASGQMTPALLRDRAVAHERIYTHARMAGIHSDAPEMQHFARELFLLARQTGAASLPDESRRLFALAREASGLGGDGLQFLLYAGAARVLGWSLAARLASLRDRLP